MRPTAVAICTSTLVVRVSEEYAYPLRGGHVPVQSAGHKEIVIESHGAASKVHQPLKSSDMHVGFFEGALDSLDRKMVRN